DGELRADGLCAVVVVHQVPTVHDFDHSRQLAREGVARLDSGVREWNGVAEENRSAVVVVVPVVTLDQLVPHVRDVLPDIEAQAGAERRDVARENLLQVELGHGLILRLGYLWDGVAAGEVDAKSG